MISLLGRTRHTREDHHRKIDELVETVNQLIEVVAQMSKNDQMMGDILEKLTSRKCVGDHHS